MIKNLLMSLFYFVLYLSIGIIILTIFNYFNIFSTKLISILKLLISVLGLFVFAYRLGKRSSKKGYLEGLKLGGLVTFIFLIISLLSKSFEMKSIIYYLILILSSTLGSMIGINRKKEAS